MGGINVLIGDESSAMFYFQHLVQPWVFALTSAQRKERLPVFKAGSSLCLVQARLRTAGGIFEAHQVILVCSQIFITIMKVFHKEKVHLAHIFRGK